jgi:hypothetical protein
MPKLNREFLIRHQFAIAVLFAIAAGGFFYIFDLSRNPPGFFIDESSVAFNAHTIAQSGRDEFGTAWPLFFRAFGEYKNPIYIYLLAAIFKVTGPGILVARALSGVIGISTAMALGVLAVRVSRRRYAGLMVGVLALLTPWLFELSRLVLEVALYPLAAALFLLAVWRASEKPTWRTAEIVCLSLTLALLTYTYSIGRLLGPLLALGLFLFGLRGRWRGLLMTLAAYSLTLLPMIIVWWRQPHVLTGRFHYVTYLAPSSTTSEIAGKFIRHYFANLNPWRLFVTERSTVNELNHLLGAPAILTITILLVIAAIVLLVYRRQISRWWIFILYGLLVSVVPASLTREHFHMLRLSALPVFLIVLTIPAFIWLLEQRSRTRRALLLIVVLLGLGQGMFFQWKYYSGGQSPRRLHIFDADYPATILPVALAHAHAAPVYLADDPARPGYIQAYWYATLQNIPLSKFVSLGFDRSPPEGAVVITTESSCPRCDILAPSEPYMTYVARGVPRELSRLPENAFKAEVQVANPITMLRSGEQASIEVTVKNASDAVWRARERSGSPFQLFVGNHWLDGNGRLLRNDDGRGALLWDVYPGQVATLPLVINAPYPPGNYILEIDMLQEDVSWFGLRGSKTWRGTVLVK